MGVLKFLSILTLVLTLISPLEGFSNQNNTTSCWENFKNCQSICEKRYLKEENETAAYKGCLFRCELNLKTCKAKKVWGEIKPKLEEKYETFKEWFKGFLQK